MGALGAEQMARATMSPGGLVTAALQREVSMSGDSPKEALVPYCSEGCGPGHDIQVKKVKKSGIYCFP